MALMGMETDSASFPNSSTSSTAKWKYDVFLSFKGDDTRYNFMSHLYEALKQKGITTFKDDVKLKRGESISQELSKAIEESRFAVVILSENYASSTWCLEELAKIIGCKKEKGMTILPIFHYVDPSDIRKQKGTFEQAFIKHEEKGNKESVEKWRNALREVGNLAGWHLKNTRSEMEDIKDIVGKISLNMKYDAIPYMTKNLVGIYSRMAEFESCLAIDSNDVLFIGIRGMGGIGKTTLARVVYYMVSKKFESCSFIENVRENSEKDGLLSLQQKLISDILNEKNFEIRNKNDAVLKIMKRFPQKKILLVLDDVNESEQLQMLAEKHDWFGPGSRIIITSRDVEVLNTHGVDDVYEVEGLEYDDALQLFCLKAFKKENVPNDYLELSKDFLKHASGHPLALEVLGSLLFGKNTNEWESALQRLKEFPNAKVLRVLRISFDTLHETEKEIFLHIACFFNHDMKDRVVEILDILDLYPTIGLRKLIDMSLLKITAEEELWMHDLLEEMGRNIVRQEFPNDPGKHSRLWRYKEIDNMLEKNKGTEVVQAMDIWGDFKTKEAAHWNPKAFLKMHNLKFLRINYIDRVPPHLPRDLKILEWNGYPAKSLPSSFQLNELTQLCLLESNIEQLWVGRKNFNKLKFINLANSLSLTITPDFTGVPHLEKLVLENCTNLCELHPSIGILKKLVFLNLAYCINLSSLPSKLEMDSLQNLDLSECSKLQKIPKSVGNLVCLQNLFLHCTPIVELPSSIERLMHLTSLTLFNCNKLVSLPNTTCGFKFHGALDLSTYLRFKNLPENPWIIEGIEELDLSKTAIEEMPSSIGCLTNLTRLTLRGCMNLVRLPSIICSLKSLESLDLFGCSNLKNLPENLGNVKSLQKLDLSETAIQELPSSIERLTRLTLLTLQGCKNLVCVPSSICNLKSLECLEISRCSSLENLPENLGNVKGLKKLALSGTAIEEMPSSIGYLTNLTRLTLRFCMNLVHLPSIICSLKSLESLDLCGCSNLKNLPENLGNVKSLQKLDLSGTAIPELPSSIECLMHLTSLTLFNCYKLVNLPNTTCGFKFHGALDLSTCLRFKNLPENPWIIKSLEWLDLSKTAIKEMPSSIGHLTNLTALALRFCMNLVHLPSIICSLKLLNSLDLFGCLKLETLPENIGNMKGLEELNLCWTSIKEVPSSIVLLKNLKILYIRGWKLSEFCSQPAGLESMDPLWNLLLPQPTSPLECIGLPSFLYYSLPTSPVLEGLLFSSLSGLHSLTHLHINDCDLLLIPDDIGCLSSLECLNLSGNNFVSLPESMSQLFNLRSLYLEGCKRLQSFENVPSTINSVIANDCSSLERLPELQFYPFRSNYSRFQCFNCFKLVDYIQNGSNMLQVSLSLSLSLSIPNIMPCLFQGLPNIVIPGGEIPKWFSHECRGDCMQLSFHGFDELIGIALCVVFVPNGSHQYDIYPNFKCKFWLNRLYIADFAQYYYFRTKYGRVESPHIWLLYLPIHHFIPNWGKIRSRIDAYGFSQLEIKIYAEVVEKIGVRLVYKQDMEDPNQTMAQCINNNSTLYEDLGVLHHDIDDSTVESSRNKQSCDVDDGAGPSGEGYSNEEPQPKWIQREFFDFFAREDEMSKKLESIHGGKSDCYQDIEDPNQIITQLCINSRTLYEDLGDRHHDLYNSAAEGSRNKLSRDEEDGAGPSEEGYSSKEPELKWIQRVGEFMADYEDSSQREIIDFFAIEGEYQTTKKLESILGGKRDSYQDIEDPNQTITQLSINIRTPYEDLGDCHHDLYDSTLEGSRNKRSHDEGGRAGPSGEGCSSDQPPSKGLEDVWLILKNFVQGMFRLFCLRESKKLEAHCSGKREGYRSDGEELPTEGPSSQTHVGTG